MTQHSNDPRQRPPAGQSGNRSQPGRRLRPSEAERRAKARHGGAPRAFRAACRLRPVAPCVTCCVWLAAVVAVATDAAAEPTRKAVALYEQERYDEAAAHLERAAKQAPQDALVHYDLGTVRYRQGRYEPAADTLHQALANADPALQGTISYNLGNTRYRQAHAKQAPAPDEAAARYRQALDAYRLAIRRDPNDRDAQFNYELTARRLQDAQARKADESKAGQSGQAQQPKASTGSESREESSQQSADQAQPQPGEPQQAGQPGQADPSTAQDAQQSAGASEPSQTQQGEAGQDGSVETAQDAAPQPAPDASEPAEASSASTPKAEATDLTKQQAIWILEGLRSEDRGMPRSTQDAAQEEPVGRDW